MFNLYKKSNNQFLGSTPDQNPESAIKGILQIPFAFLKKINIQEIYAEIRQIDEFTFEVAILDNEYLLKRV